MFPEIQHEDINGCIDYALANLPECPGYYIICFPTIGNTYKAYSGHYTGATKNLRKRYIRHIMGRGCNIIRVSNLRNGKEIPKMSYIPFPTQDIAFSFEKHAKKKIRTPIRYCPYCGPKTMSVPKHFVDAYNRAVKLFDL